MLSLVLLAVLLKSIGYCWAQRKHWSIVSNPILLPVLSIFSITVAGLEIFKLLLNSFLFAWQCGSSAQSPTVFQHVTWASQGSVLGHKGPHIGAAPAKEGGDHGGGHLLFHCCSSCSPSTFAWGGEQSRVFKPLSRGKREEKVISNPMEKTLPELGLFSL